MARIKGFNAIKKEIRQFKKKVQTATDRGINKTAHAIKDDARQRAPQEMGNLVRSIDVEKKDNTTYVYADAPHAPYQEFGTGDFAVAPAPEYADYMREFFVNGKGVTPPKPFLFPAYFAHRDKVVPNIEEELKKL